MEHAYTKSYFLFLWNSHLTENLEILFATFGNPTYNQYSTFKDRCMLSGPLILAGIGEEGGWRTEEVISSATLTK